VRTTLTLDSDVVAKLKDEMRRSGRSLKQVVNELLRLALNTRRKRQPRQPFLVRARPLGLRQGLNYHKISELLEHLEGPVHR